MYMYTARMIFGGGRKLLSLRKQEEFLGRVIVLNVALNILERPIQKVLQLQARYHYSVRGI